MNRLILGTLITSLLAGCQSPMVATRSYSFDTVVVANGKQYGLRKEYVCHHEDLTWISSRGKDWHIREGANTVRVLGLLDDGAKIQVMPRAKFWNDRFCPDATAPADVRVFVELDESNVEGFDRLKSEGYQHKVTVVDSKIVSTGSGLASFVEHTDWPKAPKAAKRYYTIYAAFYKREDWKHKPEIDSLIKSRRILWFEEGKVYPFTSWSDDDVAFARLRQMDSRIDGYTDAAPKMPLKATGEDWALSGDSRRAIQWRIEPAPANQSEEREATPSAKFKRWIIFGNSRIEIPLRSYYRTFYQPEQDRLLEFRVEHVDLW